MTLGPGHFNIQFKSFQTVVKPKASMGGSPGLEVMGDGSCLRGHGFESQRTILHGHDIF